MNRYFAIAASLLCLSLASCSTAFNREWEAASGSSTKHEFKGMTGLWSGTWLSESNGHHGELRCIVSPVKVQEQSDHGELCRFHYHATFKGILTKTYDVTHIVHQTKGGFIFSGDEQLTGLGGGLYHYEGRGTSHEFHATYRSSSDHGVFEMKRPK